MYGMNAEYRLAIDGLKAERAPERVEQRLLVNVRRRSRQLRWVRLGVKLGSVVLAACVGFLAVVAGYRMNLPEIAPPQPVMVHIVPPAQATEVVARKRAMPARRRAVKPPSEEVATRYYSLPGSDDLPAPDAEAIVRVDVPRSTLRLIGFPVNEEHRSEYIRADVVFGQDGMARAIRFVQ
jgi:hypothetical protein